MYGIGTRVVMKGVTVTKVTSNTATARFGHPRPALRESCAAPVDAGELDRALDRNESAQLW